MAVKPLGNDVSRHQGLIDWALSAARGILYSGIRTTISWAYVDPQASRNIFEALKHGVIPLMYWVLHPNEDPQRQVDHFFNTLLGFGLSFKDIYHVVDVELHAGVHQCDYKHYQTVLANALVYSTTVSGRKPIIYSRASFIDSYVTGKVVSWTKAAPTYYSLYDWWLAGYLKSGLEHPGPVALPSGVTRDKCRIHQTSDRADGQYYGMESLAMDTNRWEPGISLADYFKSTNVIIQPKPIFTVEEKLADHEVRISALEAR